MALILTTEFNGSDAGQIMSDVFATGVMFNPTNAVQLYNVSNKLSVTILEDGSFATQPYNCSFIDGDITLTDRVLNPEKFMITKSYCKSVLWDSWLSFVHANNMNPNSLMQLDANNVSSFTQYVVDFYTRKAGYEIDRIIWESYLGHPTPGLSVITGLVRRMSSAIDTIKVASAVPLTVANVKSAFEEVLTLTPSNVLAQPDFAFYINPKTASLYQMSLTNPGFYGNAANGQIALNFLGYKVVVSAGIPDNTIVATYAANLFIGTNINSVSFNIFDKSVIGEDIIGIRGQWVLDTNFGLGKNVVLYTNV